MEKEIVKIHNKDYETVASRVKRFREDKKDWSIDTVVQAFIDGVLCKTSIKDETCRVRATGIAHEKESSSHINKTSYIENCETSAIGRALACLGYLGTEFCSADELANALKNQSQPSQGTSKPTPVNQDPDGGDGKLISDGNAMIQAMTGGDTQKAIELVRKHSGFDGIEGRVERSSLEQLKGKWLFKTFKNIESEYSSFVDKENSEMQIDEPPVDPAQDTENVPF